MIYSLQDIQKSDYKMIIWEAKVSDIFFSLNIIERNG